MDGWLIAYVLVSSLGLAAVGLLASRLTRPYGGAPARALDKIANQADVAPASAPDPIEHVLLPSGAPGTAERQAELLEVYKLMVQTSEALVARRQGTNTFFLTANGLLLTAMGLALRPGAVEPSHGGAMVAFCATGLIVSWAWRSLLVSFGQLNKGKFAVILRLEKHLAAAVFDAEWEALDRGRDRAVYRSFTASESRVPLVFFGIYLVVGLVSLVIALRWWWPA